MFVLGCHRSDILLAGIISDSLAEQKNSELPEQPAQVTIQEGFETRQLVDLNEALRPARGRLAAPTTPCDPMAKR